MCRNAMNRRSVSAWRENVEGDGHGKEGVQWWFQSQDNILNCLLPCIGAEGDSLISGIQCRVLLGNNMVNRA